MNDNPWENLLVELGIASLPPEKRDEAMASLGSVIFQSMFMRAMDILEEKDKDDLEKLMEDPARAEKEMGAFLKERMPNFDQVFREEIESMRQSIRELGAAGVLNSSESKQ